MDQAFCQYHRHHLVRSRFTPQEGNGDGWPKSTVFGLQGQSHIITQDSGRSPLVLVELRHATITFAQGRCPVMGLASCRL